MRRAKVLGATPETRLKRSLVGATFAGVKRRGKFLLFTLHVRRRAEPVLLVGHLGMTGRIYLAAKDAPLAKHAAVVLDLGRHRMIYEDTRYFGRFTLILAAWRLWVPSRWAGTSRPGIWPRLGRSGQAIKIKLLDQSLVAGVGNIYASEALFLARISPWARANELTRDQLARLWRAIRRVLATAIRQDSTVPLDFAGSGARDGLFYYGRKGDANGFYAERLLVYDRQGRPCPSCGTGIKRIVQGARSTYFCAVCQGVSGGKTKIS